MSPSLPYQKIETPPSEINIQNVIVRMIDALGFRYRWATEGLTEQNLNFRPVEGSMNLNELMHHLYDLAFSIDKKFGGLTSYVEGQKNLDQLREMTLNHLDASSNRLKNMDDQAFEQMVQNDSSKYSFWYWLNGPVADALTHVGQVVSWRRIAGNPQPKGVNVFSGTATPF